MKSAAAALASLILAGCAAQGDFPSLAPRAIEQRGAQSATQPAPLTPSDPARIARIEAAERDAFATTSAFQAALVTARNAAAGAGRAKGSESWIAAQMALSQLERARGPVEAALARLSDEKRALLLGPPSADRDVLMQAWDRVSQLNARQDADIRTLIDALNPR